MVLQRKQVDLEDEHEDLVQKHKNLRIKHNNLCAEVVEMRALVDELKENQLYLQAA